MIVVFIVPSRLSQHDITFRSSADSGQCAYREMSTSYHAQVTNRQRNLRPSRSGFGRLYRRALGGKMKKSACASRKPRSCVYPVIAPGQVAGHAAVSIPTRHVSHRSEACSSCLVTTSHVRLPRGVQTFSKPNLPAGPSAFHALSPSQDSRVSGTATFNRFVPYAEQGTRSDGQRFGPFKISLSLLRS